MPRKRSSKPAKSTGRPRKTASKSAPSKKPTGGKTSQKGKPAANRTRSRTPASSPTPRPVRQGMSLDRKLDILGIGLVLVGILTLLSLLSSNNSSLVGGWVSALEWTFGLGGFVFPFALLISGLWLVLRNFERVPQLAMERLLGLVLLFANFLAVLHFAAMLNSGQKAFDLAESGSGGGYLGALFAGSLEAGLGMGGAAIALAAWFLIALALTLDITVLEMARKATPLAHRLQDGWIEILDALGSRQKRVVPGVTGFEGAPGSTAGDMNVETQAGIAPDRGPIFPPSGPMQPIAAGAAPTWILPPIDQVLDEGGEANYDDEIDLARARVIEETLSSFGAPARVVEINRGPTITQFGVEPDYIESRNGRMRVRVGKITSLADDLALALSARTIRIQAPVPGKGFVGVEVPNDEISLVMLRDLIESEAFRRLKSPLRFALGLNVSGNAVAADLAVMPHLLIAGATGSGKSVCVNALICCLLAHNTPEDLRLVMVDPKRVELSGYNGIPHLLAPVVVELERVIAALQWVTREMDLRYHKLAEAGCRNILEYNARQIASGGKKLPFLVVIIDELADLMMLAPDETERTITRLAQLARATGIHLVIATQRPSVDVVTGLIKANFPARIAFAVASGVDSRVILDQPGAERLLGRGDMLFQSPDAPAPVRLQGVFVSDGEIQRLVTYWQGFAGLAQPGSSVAGGIVDAIPSNIPLKQIPLWEELEEQQNADPLLNEAIDLARRQGRASISMLQRHLRIGYTRAARLIETMEEKNIIGPPDPGSGTREILDYGPAAPPADER
jgi:S-DNA-T family DNA segregation ATPase FtsK/SpoIIIE